ncbi:type I-E CRISPR-associated protein Cas7/Cse4/CasC [Marinobacter sp. SS21]|uniref:type I-E CRISPR-associated protein Cas7/Cse4/CasC n=1 Tax=Marinobacter sp. SS21 TaxID=2979460 RepID=UPI00232D16F3|nr:type I-E CRISPR-associated protein Cas7/Cse4/CasC [Marinobacter sp. SS21]MDC0662563.1 type I-E CRISPR-associated protein Cas7/Cse4/CasC [Marinobacter sp. SS21]
MTNNYTNTRIEYHILQSFPVTCLNRDDVGAPKSAMVGGVQRARVSSQCWKRQVRLAMQEFGIKLGIRTKKVESLITENCIELGASEEQATKCGDLISSTFVKEKKGKNGGDDAIEPSVGDDNDTLLFWSQKEIQTIAESFKNIGFDTDKFFTAKDKKKWPGQLASLIGKSKHDLAMNALDIVLFGRMVAKAAEMNVEAAASFSHAISTHKVSNEVEFFTALDDSTGTTAHMGSLEYNSATYYRYISLDLGQLAQTMGEADLKKAVEAFTKALFVAVPTARQTTQSGASPWEFARVMVRKGQRLQVPFEAPVKARDSGFLQPSIDTLKEYLDKKEKLTGSLFGKQAAYDWGEDENFSIDALVESLQSHVQ